MYKRVYVQVTTVGRYLRTYGVGTFVLTEYKIFLSWRYVLGFAVPVAANSLCTVRYPIPTYIFRNRNKILWIKPSFQNENISKSCAHHWLTKLTIIANNYLSSFRTPIGFRSKSSNFTVYLPIPTKDADPECGAILWIRLPPNYLRYLGTELPCSPKRFFQMKKTLWSGPAPPSTRSSIPEIFLDPYTDVSFSSPFQHTNPDFVPIGYYGCALFQPEQ